MEEIKLLVEAVAKLPNAALWVLLGYLVYKLAVVGSIYGTVRYVVEKVHDVLKQRIEAKTKPIIHLYKWKEGVEPINEEVKDRIINTLLRLKAHNDHTSSLAYVHSSLATKLEDLVNDYISSTPLKK